MPQAGKTIDLGWIGGRDLDQRCIPEVSGQTLT
jgi:hypothetical protein